MHIARTFVSILNKEKNMHLLLIFKNYNKSKMVKMYVLYKIIKKICTYVKLMHKLLGTCTYLSNV